MSETVSTWSRRYVLVSVVALVLWQAGILLGVSHRAEIVLGLFGFVFHMIFGKAYALVPSYFDSELAIPRAPAIQFPLVALGTVGLASSSLGVGPSWLESGGILLWSLGIVVFVGALLLTIRQALLAGETGTGEHNARRRPLDRTANVFVPVALLYLLAGSYETAAGVGLVPPLFDGLHAQAVHLLAAGTAAVLVFALGFRLLPRFLVVYPPAWPAYIVLPLAAFGPVALAAGLTDSQLLTVGAMLEAVAVCVFAGVVFWMFARSDRRRVGFYSVLAAMGSGVLGVVLGVSFAVNGVAADLVTLHFRLNVLGFLGLTVVGLAYQFYPPAVGDLPGSNDRTALLSIGGVSCGLLLHVVGVATGFDGVVTTGYLVALSGSVLYAYLVSSAFVTRG